MQNMRENLNFRYLADKEFEVRPLKIRHLVEDRGTSLAALARSNGMSDAAIRYALKYPARRAEEVLSTFLELPPNVLFPDRYDKRGRRRVRFAGLGPYRSLSALQRKKGQ